MRNVIGGELLRLRARQHHAVVQRVQKSLQGNPVSIQAADSDTLDQSAQAPGLLAIALSLGANIRDDQDLLRAGLVIYDALYAWCQSLTGERHGWHPDTVLKEMRT